MKKLFNIAGQDIEKKLGTDRNQKNLNVVEEDLKFYEDQKKERKMFFAKFTSFIVGKYKYNIF